MADRHRRNNDGRDWSSLPSDVLATIAHNLLPLPDYIHLRSVCKSWANAVPRIPMPSPLLVSPTNAADSLTFCPLASPQTTFQSPAPPGVAWTHIVGSHDGWLALFGLALNLFLLNPFTADRIDLPPSTALPGFDLPSNRQPVWGTQSRDCYVRKIVFKSSPTPQNLMAVAVDIFGGIAYTRAGEDTWNSFQVERNSIKYEFNSFWRDLVYDVMFHDGRFWAINRSGKLFAFDLRGEGLPEVWITFDTSGLYSLRRFWKDAGMSRGDRVLLGYKYLAVGNDGNVVIVFRDKGEGGGRFHGSSLVVIEIVGPKLDRAGQATSLGQARRVRSLGGHCIYVGYNNGFSLPAEEGCRLRGNCVFINDTICVMYNMGVFDMENESFDLMLPQCIKTCQTPSVIFLPIIKQNNLESTSSSNTLTVVS